MSTSANKFSAEEHARLDSYMLIIAGEARGHHKHDGSGKHTFGSKGAYCVYADGQYHDFSSSGPTAHGHGALAQIRHLYPDVDSVAWARAFLAAHPGAGDFVPGADTNTKGSAEEDAERLAYITALYAGAALLTEDTPGYRFFVEGRRLSAPSRSACAVALGSQLPRRRGSHTRPLHWSCRRAACVGLYVHHAGCAEVAALSRAHDLSRPQRLEFSCACSSWRTWTGRG